MIEITGDLWEYWLQPKTVVCITTNGYVNDRGLAAMGAGCAKEATKEVKNLTRIVGTLITQNGNKVQWVPIFGGRSMLLFPTKDKFWEDSNFVLITKSAVQLKEIAIGMPDHHFILPRPGCGQGKLEWREVRPLTEILPSNVYIISRRDE